jgi:O-antigen/teichoic acid export membrane protein
MAIADRLIPDMKELSRHIGIGAILTVSQAIFGFILVMVNIRLLSTDDFAGYAILLATATGVIHLMGQALAALATRETARATGDGFSDADSILFFLTVSGGVSAILAFVITFVLGDLFWPEASLRSVILSGFIASTGVISVISCGSLSGLGHPLKSHSIGVSQSAVTLALCGLVVALNKEFTLETIMMVQATGAVLLATWSLLLLRRALKGQDLSYTAPTHTLLSQRLRFVIPLWVSVGLGAVTLKMPILLVGAIFTPATVAVFSISTQFGNLAKALPSILSKSLSRAFHQTHQSKDIRTLKKLLRKGEIISLLSALVTFCGFALLGQTIINTAFDIVDPRAYWLSLAFILYGGVQVVVGLRCGLLGLFSHTTDAMILKSIELGVLAIGLTVVWKMNLDVYSIAFVMGVSFLVWAASTLTVMNKRKLLHEV